MRMIWNKGHRIRASGSVKEFSQKGLQGLA